MSLAKIQRALAETQQRHKHSIKENSKRDGGLVSQDIPQISLSWQRQTSSLSFPFPDPLPLANLGSLLFSLSGFPISKSAETFNVTNLEKTSQVLVVVVENISMTDLSQKPNMLSSFRRIVAENGFSVVLQPSLALAHTTGSDLSQVELSFSKDATIIKTLVSEISGTRKLKPATERNPSFLNTKDVAVDNNVEEHSASDDASNDDVAQDEETNIKRHIKEFALRFSQRHNYNVELQGGQIGRTLLHPKKRHALPYAESKHTNRTNGEVRQNEDLTGDKSLTEEGFPLSKISRPDLKVLLEKLERLNQEHVSLEYKLRKLQSGDSKGGNAKSAAQLQRTREQLDQKQMEFKKAKEEWEQFKQDSGQLTTAENQEKYKGRNDLLQYLNRIIRAPKPKEVNGLIPVGTVLNPGNLDRSKPEMFDRRYLMLSLTDMKLNGFNLEFSSLRKQYAPVTRQSRMFGVDCEMCLTMNMISELTRLTVVDEDGIVLLDELVKPRGRIINYLTQFSGITPEMMQGVTMTREDVVKKLAELLPPDAILVGHSLDSDLKALCITHPYCIDTSICYSVKGGHQKSKLKVLMKTFFGEDIQSAGAAGHSSAEDSFAALRLIILKLQHDISFGDIDMNPSFEWNGINYKEALNEAMNIVSNERRTQTFKNTCLRNPARRPKAFKRDVDPMALIGMTPEENNAYLEKKEELRWLVKERKRQEMAVREIQRAMRSQDDVGYKVFREHQRRLKALKKMKNYSEKARVAVIQKFDKLERQKKDILDQHGDNSERKQSTSAVVLLAKERFITAKINEIENHIKIILPNQKSKLKQLHNKKHRLRDELQQVQKAIIAQEKAQKTSEELQNDSFLFKTENPNKNAIGTENASDIDSNDEIEAMAIDYEISKDAELNLNEADILRMVEEGDRALQIIRKQEEEFRKELERNEATARKAVMEMRIEKKHQDDETLARRLVKGNVNIDEVFIDEAALHRFIKYQLFVQRKNEEFVRKRGYGFGTVALEKLYLNIFSAWKMAEKKSVVVAEEAVANVHYDDVNIIPPKDSSISSTIRTTRRCLSTHDLVVSHLLYDDVHENEDDIDSGLCQVWESVKRGGVVVVILEGSYHFKQIGLGLGMIAIRR
ncbi:uncharacterized protein LOC111266403 [Varroa jacobsoni]|uniref:Exonuclease domain-containing protein n=1 Tax=Varroa destructor TaxID=109461 RepID=A0A7M7KCX0_VARDE|nr:uncharacterized protein LOC111251508 [Varroa destructor]XP_022699608.1 uncharacterized protein LOC111266403 [Varroa jacobsoni]